MDALALLRHTIESLGHFYQLLAIFNELLQLSNLFTGVLHQAVFFEELEIAEEVTDVLVLVDVATLCIQVLAHLVRRLYQLLDDECARLVLFFELLFKYGVQALIQRHLHLLPFNSRHIPYLLNKISMLRSLVTPELIKYLPIERVIYL